MTQMKIYLKKELLGGKNYGNLTLNFPKKKKNKIEYGLEKYYQSLTQ
jgi:hypothetical protein